MVESSLALFLASASKYQTRCQTRTFPTIDLCRMAFRKCEKCGYKLPEVAAKPTEVPTAAPCLKGKARKLAKQAGGTSAAPSTPKEAPNHRHSISTKGFVFRTKAIAECVSSQVIRFKSSKCQA
jgi:hypothetical protein